MSQFFTVPGSGIAYEADTPLAFHWLATEDIATLASIALARRYAHGEGLAWCMTAEQIWIHRPETDPIILERRGDLFLLPVTEFPEVRESDDIRQRRLIGSPISTRVP